MDASMLILAVGLVLGTLIALVAMIGRDRRSEANERRLIAIERRLQLVMDHLGVAERAPIMADVARWLDQGRKIQAIKAYREATGAGLAEAKKAVEEMARQRGV
jgi:hypothetical protein